MPFSSKEDESPTERGKSPLSVLIFDCEKALLKHQRQKKQPKKLQTL